MTAILSHPQCVKDCQCYRLMPFYTSNDDKTGAWIILASLYLSEIKSLVSLKVMVCHLPCTKPWSKPMLTYCTCNRGSHCGVFLVNFLNNFCSRNYSWKLQYGHDATNFVHGMLSYLISPSGASVNRFNIGSDNGLSPIQCQAII